jgi:hypothetical protein
MIAQRESPYHAGTGLREPSRRPTSCWIAGRLVVGGKGKWCRVARARRRERSQSQPVPVAKGYGTKRESRRLACWSFVPNQARCWGREENKAGCAGGAGTGKGAGQGVALRLALATRHHLPFPPPTTCPLILHEVVRTPHHQVALWTAFRTWARARVSSAGKTPVKK